MKSDPVFFYASLVEQPILQTLSQNEIASKEICGGLLAIGRIHYSYLNPDETAVTVNKLTKCIKNYSVCDRHWMKERGSILIYTSHSCS